MQPVPPEFLYPPDICKLGLRTTVGQVQVRSESDIWSVGRQSLEVRKAIRKHIIARNTSEDFVASGVMSNLCSGGSGF